MNLSVYTFRTSLAKMMKEQQLLGTHGLAMDVRELLVLGTELLVFGTELFSTHESESSEYWNTAEVQAVGSYCVALGAVLGMLVGFVVR